MLLSGVTISHADTSNVTGLSSLSNSGGVVLQNISILVDDFGHITGATLSSANLDNRFLGLNSTSINSDKLGGYTLSQLTGFTEDRYLSISGGTLVGPRAFCYLQILVLGGKLLKVVIIICDIESVSLKLDGIASLH